jgi:hypothetical protein
VATTVFLRLRCFRAAATTGAGPLSEEEARKNRRKCLEILNAKRPDRITRARSVREAKKLEKSDVEQSKHTSQLYKEC